MWNWPCREISDSVRPEPIAVSLALPPLHERGVASPDFGLRDLPLASGAGLGRDFRRPEDIMQTVDYLLSASFQAKAGGKKKKKGNKEEQEEQEAPEEEPDMNDSPGARAPKPATALTLSTDRRTLSPA